MLQLREGEGELVAARFQAAGRSCIDLRNGGLSVRHGGPPAAAAIATGLCKPVVAGR